MNSVRKIVVGAVFLCSQGFFCYGACFVSQESCLQEPVYSVAQCKDILGGISLFVHRGHKGVTDSLLRGFQALGVPYTINSNDAELYPHVFVLAGIEYLRHALELKKSGVIKTLLVGPNIMGLPTDYDMILASPEIDAYLVPSDWTAQVVREDVPTLTTCVWYSGVDTQYWSPITSDNKQSVHRKILVYRKTETLDFCQCVEACIERMGYVPVRIEYGRYTHEQYKHIMENVCAAVFISRSESQGLALAECWSMNVPTLVWDPCEPLVIAGRLYSSVVAAPYCTSAVGKTWSTVQDLERLLANLSQELYNPRLWCQKYMSDVASVHRLLNVFVHVSNVNRVDKLF